MTKLQTDLSQVPDCLSLSSPDDSRSSTPKSDSELTSQNKDNPEMLWTWGELPQAAQVFTHSNTHTHCRKHLSTYFIQTGRFTGVVQVFFLSLDKTRLAVSP